MSLTRSPALLEQGGSAHRPSAFREEGFGGQKVSTAAHFPDSSIEDTQYVWVPNLGGVS